MEKKSFLLVLILIPLSVYGSYLSTVFLQEGRTWIYDYHHFEEIETGKGITYKESVFEVSYTIQGDTVIGGLTYAKLLQLKDDACRYYAALREDGTTVFCMNAGESNEFVLLEYDPKKFSSIDGLYGEYTEHRESVNVDGRIFMRHLYEPVDHSDSPKLVGVDGVGFKDCGIMGMIQLLPTCICDYASFKACYEDGKCIFTNDNFCNQSISEDIKVIDDFALDNSYGSKNHKSSGKSYDLQGRRLAGKPAKGIFIQDGKKRVVISGDVSPELLDTKGKEGL